MVLDASVQNTHVVNIFGPVLPEVTDQEVSLLFHGLWQRHAVPIGQTYGPSRLSLWHIHDATFEDEGVVVHVRGGEVFAGQVCNSVPDLVMTRPYEAAHLAFEGMITGEFGIAAVTVIAEV